MKTNFKTINTLLIVLVSIITQQISAQSDKGFYASLNSGYNINFN
jgi:hypothetical protein